MYGRVQMGAAVCVCACVCACRMGQADTGGLEGRRGESLSARDSARIAPSYVDVGAWRGRWPRAMGPIAMRRRVDHLGGETRDLP